MSEPGWILIRMAVATAIMLIVAAINVESIDETETRLILSTVAALAGADVLQTWKRGKL